MREALLLAIGRLVCTTPWFILCCVPLYHERRVSRAVMALIITAVSILFFLCNFWGRIQYANFATYGSGVFCVLYLVLIGLFIWGFRAAFVKLLYIFLLVQAVSTAINYSAAIILKPFYPGIRITLQDTPAYTLVILMLTIFLAPFLWHFFSHQLREAMKELSDRDFRLLAIPPVLFFIITVIFNNIGANPAIPQSLAIAIFLLIMVSGFVTYYLNVHMALDTARRIRMETDMAAMERQLKVQLESYEQLAMSIESERVARHDLRHHLAALAAFVEEDDMKGLSEYLTEYRGSLPEEENLNVCDNYIVNTIVRYYLIQAQKAGAQLDVKLELPADIGIRDTDLTIIFGNLFENAAQGVAGQTGGLRFVKARCGIEQGKLILTVDNSKESQIGNRKGKNISPGTGQLSVKAVADKYHGSVRFEDLSDTYRGSVLLTLPSE